MADLSNGRGWLNPAEAASIARIDRHLGRPLQISEAGRSFFQQEKFYNAWLNGTGNYALSPYGPPRGNGPSVHQSGGAIDTDDWVRYTWLLNEHGWFQTVFWPDGSLREGWHFEYFASRDKHINDPAPAPADVAPVIPAGEEEEDEMATKNVMHHRDHAAYKYEVSISNPGSGFYMSYVTNDPETNGTFAAQYETGDSIKVSDSMFRVIAQAAAAVRPQTSLKVEVANADA